MVRLTAAIMFAALALLVDVPAALSQGACDAIAARCASHGFAASGGARGKRVAEDCVRPILDGSGGRRGLPLVSGSLIAQCWATLDPTAGLPPDGKAAAGPGPVAAPAFAAGKAMPPNIVMILVDDFSLDLMSQDQNILQRTMPNLAKLMQDGAQFSQYFVTDSLCCPSRSSIFTGLLPHNSGVFTNGPPNGGYEAFMANGDDARTFALPLHDAGYATAMMGKYLNGYDPLQDGVPAGWSEWAVAGNGYPNFGYALNHNGRMIRSPLHLTDKLSSLGQDFIKASAGTPFLLELATFSPHAPYVPPVRYASDFADLTYPRSPAFGARPDASAPDWLHQIKPLNAVAIDRMQENFLDRLRSDKGIDDMIGAIRKTLDDLGLSGRTYVIFTSDNGYHMGEYSLRAGKMTPFDTDIHVPLVIAGPGVAPGQTIDALTMNIDFYPTFAEWAGAAGNPAVDGRSLAGLLQGKPMAPWRNIAVVEHRHDDSSISLNPDHAAFQSGNPPDYTALRMPGAMYVEYDDPAREVGYYDLTRDPYELHNIAGTLSPERLRALHEAVVANSTCRGPGQCSAAQQTSP